jgi:predicted dehydrogenase
MAVRVGVVGVGFMGKTHLGIYAKNKRAIVTAYCDIDPKKAKGDFGGGGGNLGDGGATQLGAGAKGYRKVEDLLNDPNVDLVDICLPTYLHAEYAIKALQTGKHVMCEKPLTVDLKDAERVVKAAQNAKGFLMTAHCIRFWPEWAWLKDAVDSRRFGKVHSAVFRRFASTPTWTSKNWILNADLSGSALFDLHVHDSDFIRYVFGNPKAVFSVGNGGKATKTGIDHIVTSYLYKDPNLLISAEGGWNADPTYGFTMRYTVVFEKATLDYDIGREGHVLQLHKAGAKQPEVIKVPAHNGWEGEIDYYLKCIENGRAPTVTTPSDAKASVALVHAELKSVKLRKPVKV